MTMKVWIDPKGPSSFAGFILFGWHGLLKAPWNSPLFSESYGHKKFVPLGFGWRFRVARLNRLSHSEQIGGEQ